MAWVMEDKIDRALDVLVKDDLPAFVAYIYVRTVDVALVERVTGREDPESSSIADGLAEVFVLSDPSRPDNPIVFTSEGNPSPKLLRSGNKLTCSRIPSDDGIFKKRIPWSELPHFRRTKDKSFRDKSLSCITGC